MRIPCTRCRHFDREAEVCAPLARGRLRSVLEDGACRPGALAADLARRYTLARYPDARARLDDIAGEVALKLASRQEGQALPCTYPALRRWLFTVTARVATDVLRKERVVARKRCGACAHYGAAPPPGCRRTTVPDPATGRPRPNPWYGDRVASGTDPGALEPPCPGFFWRYRPQALGDRPAAARPTGGETDPRRREILDAMERLAARGPEGLRRALALRRHYIEGERTEAIARALGVTARTVRREIARGLDDLRAMLGEGR